MRTIKQYRVSFTSVETVNGNFADVPHSTKWYNDIAACRAWMWKDNAKIITRHIVEITFKEYKTGILPTYTEEESL